MFRKTLKKICAFRNTKTMILTDKTQENVQYELVTMQNRSIVPIRGVSKNEAEIIIEANTIIHKFHDFIRKFKEVELNYDDYWRTVSRYEALFKDELSGKSINYDFREQSFTDINRAYNNYAASVKSFTELCRIKVKKKFNDQSTQHLEFEKIMSGLFDGHLCYRLIQKTRDFALHAKFPIQEITYINESEVKIEVKFSRDLFLENDAMRKAVGKDIENFEPFFEVKPFLVKMPDLLELVLRKFILLTIEDYEDAANIILKLEAEAETDMIGLNIPDFKVYGTLTNNTKVIPVYMAKTFKHFST